MERSWENLLPPLLELILDRLLVPDYLRFAAVCPLWRRVQRDHRLRRGPSARQMPWLLLPEDKNSPQRRLFYSPSEQRYYRLPLPTAAAQGSHSRLHSTPSGASHGWLLFLDDESLLLVNPFSGSEIQIPTPSSIFPGIDYYLVALSSSPTDPNCIVFVWKYASSDLYCYYRINDKHWKQGITSRNHMICDMIDFNSTDPLPVVPAICGGHLYLAWGGSNLTVIDPLSKPKERCLGMSGLPKPVANSMKFFVDYDGQILLTIVTFEQEQGKHIKGFEVFKGDLIRKMWVRLESLGDRVLFLGHGHYLCLPAINTGGPENRIYFTWSLKSLWFEYDYGSHQVVSSNPRSLSENVQGCFNNDHLRWVVPGLC